MHHLLFERHVLAAKDKMFRFACSMLGNKDDAKDAVQDAMVKIWNQKELLADIRNPEAWCMQVTRNLCLDRYKAVKIRRQATEKIKALQEEKVPTPYDRAEQKDRVEKLRQLINELPEKAKMVIHLRDVEGYSYKEIGEILGISLDEVKINIFRARKLLKDQLIKNKAYGFS